MKLYDDKHQQEVAGFKAFMEGNYRSAFISYYNVARITLELAKSSRGVSSTNYLEDVNSVIDLVEKLKSKHMINLESNDISMLESLKANEDQELTLDVEPRMPKINMSDFVGYEQVKHEVLDRIFNYHLHPELYEKFGISGSSELLLFGPPGCGKSLLARAIAGELGASYFYLSGRQLADKVKKMRYYGELSLAGIVDRILDMDKAVLHMDDVEYVLGSRNKGVNMVLHEFLMALDRLKRCSERRHVIIAETRQPWSLDSAILRVGKISEHFYVGLPDGTDRKEILKVLVTEAVKEELISENIDLSDISSKTVNFSSQELVLLVDRVIRLAIKRQIDTGEEMKVKGIDFHHALRGLQHANDQITEKMYFDWQNDK